MFQNVFLVILDQTVSLHVIPVKTGLAVMRERRDVSAELDGRGCCVMSRVLR